jgi:Rrf2 family nitric oxide-sensitive transcriptional repressor
MRLTQWTDFSLRVLMYCAACQHRDLPVTITEIADSHGISRSHLTKVVHQLGAHGLLETTRGRGGGMRLCKPATKINVGEVVRQTETDFAMVECFDAQTNQCSLSPQCRLKGVLQQATNSFLAVLDGVTLADLVAPAANRAKTTKMAMPVSRKSRTADDKKS